MGVGDYFRKGLPVARPAVPPETGACADDERPGWAAGTSVYRAIGRTLDKLDQASAPVIPMAVDDNAPRLPRRDDAGPWLTRQGEEVSIGDLVALSLLNRPDAVGRIVRAAGEGKVECVLGEYEDPRGTRPALRVDVDNILMLLRKGGETMARNNLEDYCRATPAMRDPETEGGTEGDESAEAERNPAA